MDIYNYSFFKNNEYFSDFETGYTGIGSILQPTLKYQLSSYTSFYFGYHLLKYSGIDNYTEILPLINVTHSISDKLKIIMGHLRGNLNHSLSEPLYRFDNSYQKNVENGIQFLYNSKHYDFDLWMDWEKFIFTDDPFQEEFVVGYNSSLDLIKKEKINLGTDFQFLFTHKGGQIDAANASKQTTLNSDLNLSFNYLFKEDHNMALKHSWLSYEGIHAPPSGDPNHLAYKDGFAYYSQFIYRIQWFKLMLGYWKAKRFMSPRGEFLFQSVSRDKPEIKVDDRRMITSKLYFTQLKKGPVKLQLRADIYYDLDQKFCDYVYGFYLIFTENFFLRKIK
jgi:hypothetical protein